LGDKVNPGGANAINTDLRPFVNRGGKVIHYMGWAENLISARNSLHYYDNVKSFMGTHSSVQMDSFYRVFPVPGMEHCLGGEGANVFGAIAHPAIPTSDATHNNMLAGLVQWVEGGSAPDYFTATHFTNNDPTQPVQFTRPICKYPTSPVYKGGDRNSAASFKCI